MSPPRPTGSLKLSRGHVPGQAGHQGGSHKGSSDRGELRQAALKRRPHGAPRKRSALVRQRAVGGALPLALELAHLKKPGPVPKGLAARAGQIHKPGAKDLDGLKKAMMAGRKAAMKSMAPAKSALIHQKSHAAGGRLPQAGELAKAKALATGGLAKELAQVKKAASIQKGSLAQKAGVAHKVGAKDLAGLKKAALAGRKVAMKSMSPAKSALVRQKSHGDKGGLLHGAELAAVAGGLARELGRSRKPRHGAGPGLKKRGSLAHKAKPNAKVVRKLGHPGRGLK